MRDVFSEYKPPLIFTQGRKAALRVLQSELSDVILETIMFYSRPIEDVEWYRLVIPKKDYYTMFAASYLMQPEGYWSQNFHMWVEPTPGVAGECLPFTVNYINSRGAHPNWLYPQHLNIAKHNSELGHLLLPLVDMAIQGKTSSELLRLFFEQVPSLALILNRLPWIRTLIDRIEQKKLNYSEPSIHTFFNKCKETGQPRYVPGVSRWFAQACQYGTELIALHMMVNPKPKDSGSNDVAIMPVLSDAYLETGTSEQFKDFVKNMKPPEPPANATAEAWKRRQERDRD